MLVEQKTLDQFLEEAGVTDGDYVVVSDGSGSDLSREVGYGSVLIDMETRERTVLWGAMSAGTVNIAELLAVLQSLTWIEKHKRTHVVKVHVFTDSKYCSDTATSGKGPTQKSNGGFWSFFEQFARQGVRSEWHHIPRATMALNVYVDKISKLARLRVKGYNVCEQLEEGSSAENVNPDTAVRRVEKEHARKKRKLG